MASLTVDEYRKMVCGWYKSCLKTDGVLNNPLSVGPNGVEHKIDTDYTIELCGTSIPIVKTKRTFKVTTQTTWNDKGSPYWLGLTLFQCVAPKQSDKMVVQEDCDIEKSVIYYIDQRSEVCLYRYQKDSIHLDVVGTDVANFNKPDATYQANFVEIKTNNYTATTTVEWRLVTKGSTQVLKATEYEIEPFGIAAEVIGGPDHPDCPGCRRDKETREVLVRGEPPSGMRTAKCPVCLGFYSYAHEAGEESELQKQDGGFDYFYPEWCRNLQEDPFWRKAADNRYNVYWYKADLEINEGGYIPPDIVADYMPRGNFVSHPEIGDFWQFIVNKENGYITTKENDVMVRTPNGDPDNVQLLYAGENLTPLIDVELAKAEDKDGNALGLSTYDQTMYTPFGVI